MLTWTYLRRTPLFWPVIFIGVLVAVIAAIAHHHASDMRALQESGVTVQGEIVDKTMRKGSRGKRTYQATFKFTARDGGEHRQTAKVSESLFSRIERGAPAEVRYLEGQPDTAMLAQDLASELESSQIVAYVCGGIGAVLVVLLLRAFGTARRRAHVIQFGQSTTGFVRAFEDKPPVKNNPGARVLLVAYADNHQQGHEVRSPVLPPRLREQWQQDDPIQVCFDPRDPGRAEVDIFGLAATNRAARQA